MKKGGRKKVRPQIWSKDRRKTLHNRKTALTLFFPQLTAAFLRWHSSKSAHLWRIAYHWAKFFPTALYHNTAPSAVASTRQKHHRKKKKHQKTYSPINETVGSRQKTSAWSRQQREMCLSQAGVQQRMTELTAQSWATLTAACSSWRLDLKTEGIYQAIPK